MSDRHLDTLIDLALDEDLGERGDVTSLNFVPDDHQSIGEIVARESCVISGCAVMDKVIARVDRDLQVETLVGDGGAAEKGDVIYRIRGCTQSILTAERTALNFAQRLSGVATTTRRYCKLVEHTKVGLLDTRKTTPGWRVLEKQAVVHGGGVNHRMGLYDAAMLKDNHLVANDDAAAIGEQLTELRGRYPGIDVIIEADLLKQVELYLKVNGVTRILLDNMSLDELREAVRLRDELSESVGLEASGGVTDESIASIAETGVDFISVGALTHSVRSIDLGLDLRDA